MAADRDLDALIERLVSGCGEHDPWIDTERASLAGSSDLHSLERVFAAFSSLRRAHETAGDPFVGADCDVRAVGDWIGAFRLLRPIGSGGMGEVWLAERHVGTAEQRVAIKFLRRVRAGQVELFAREQGLLARLSHPCIARFLDAGRDSNGVPYLAMEYVEGTPIDAHCARRVLDLRAKLSLFLHVCDAVEHAHRQFIVHRDLKPANVLVDTDGLPRLLDFGIAKLIDAASPAVETRTLAPAITLAYAAPEQFRGDPVSAATDVHALGLILFQLLAGGLPASRRQASLSSLASGVDIERLSMSVMTDGIDPRQLQGDLDAIVSKATRPDPGDRYGSAAEFADDLRQYLAGRPVRARTPTSAYRLRKFMRRHRVGVAASALALTALIGGLAIALWQAGIAREQARRAEMQTVRASRIADFMTGLLREQDPLSRGSARSRSARELVAEGVQRARAELAGEPGLLSSMLGVLGEATVNLGDVDGGRTLLQEARTMTDADSMSAARLDGLLGNIAIRQGQAAAGADAIGRAVERLRTGSQTDRIAAAKLDIRRAFALFTQGKVDEALKMLENSHAELVAALGSDHVDAIEVESGILSVLAQMRRDEEAEELARRLVTRIERVFGTDSPWLPNVLSDWASVEKRRERYAQSEALLERAIMLSRRHQGEINEFLAALYSRLANLYQDSGQPEKALDALDQSERALPPNANVERAQMLATRGETLIDLDRSNEAEIALREALRLRRASAGADDGLVWYTQSEWGRALNALGRYAEAEQVQTEALANMERIMGLDAYQLTFVLRAIGDTLTASGQMPSEIVPIRRRTLELAERRYPASHPIVAQYRVALASALQRAGDPDAAMAEAETLLIERTGHPELSAEFAQAALVKAKVLAARGLSDKSIAMARQGLVDLDFDRAHADHAATRRELIALSGDS